jgi:hypothetical protein
MADEQKILLPNGGGPNGILAKIIINFQVAIIDETDQRIPARERIVNGLAEETLGRNSLAGSHGGFLFCGLADSLARFGKLPR